MADDVTVLAVDGDNLFHRAYHAFATSDLRAPGGAPAWAPSGFVSLLTKMVSSVRPTRLVLAFDDAAGLDRAKRYPQYKATRPARGADVASQRRMTIELLDGIGLHTVSHAGAEADDIVASTATAASERGWSTVIASSDRDVFAAISEHTTVLHLAAGVAGAPVIDADGLVARTGVTPDQYLLFAALRGDTSDNLPGVPGFGEVTAARLATTVTADILLADPAAAAADVVSERCVARLVENRDLLVRNLDLMRLVVNLDVDVDAAGVTIDRMKALDVAARFGATRPVGKLQQVLAAAHVQVEVSTARTRRRSRRAPRAQILPS